MGLFDIVTNFIKDVPVVGDVVKGVTSFIDLVDDDDDGKGRFGSLFKAAGYAPIKPTQPPSIRGRERGSTVPQRTTQVGPSLVAYRRYIEGTRGYKDLIRMAQAEAGGTVATTSGGKVSTVRGGTPMRVPTSKTLKI